MFLQGNLQVVFDVLYKIGVIDPVLSMNWGEAIKAMPKYKIQVNQAVKVANELQTNAPALERRLKEFDSRILEFLAMEVAREFADYHSRNLVH